MIKTLKDLNNAGKRFWSRPNRDDAGKRAQDALSVAQAQEKLDEAKREERAAQGTISRLNAARRAVTQAQEALALAEKSKNVDAGAGGLPQEIADMLAVQGKMTLEQIQEELERSGWDVTRGQILVSLAAAKAKNSGGVWRPE